MPYIDGCVIPVSTESKEKYLKHAKLAAGVLKEYGALSVVDCWGDDVPEGKITSFSMAVRRKEGETVVFSWITWPSRAARDQGWEKVMKDSRMSLEANPMPFDSTRMIFGGFDMILDL